MGLISGVGRAVRATGRVGGRAVIGGIGGTAVGGPIGGLIGSVAGMGTRPVAALRKGSLGHVIPRPIPLRAPAMNALGKSRASNAAFYNAHPRTNAALGMAAKHPLLTAAAIYTPISAYNRAPGANRSNRNQNSAYLRAIRSGQQSSSMSRHVGSSTGAYA